MNLFHFLSTIEPRPYGIKGVYFCTRRSTHGYVNLYGIERFYVEVFYHTDYNEIEDIRCFQSVYALDPYLELIDISLQDLD